MFGGAEGGIYVVDTNGDVIVEGAAEGTAYRVKLYANYNLPDGILVELQSITDDTGAGPINLYGKTLTSTITGPPARWGAAAPQS